MFFSNSATLIYNDASIRSNPVSGELLSALMLYKNASLNAYPMMGQLQYTISIANLSDTAYSSLCVMDDLGKYDFSGFPRFPLAYVANSASLTYYGPSGITNANVLVSETQDGVLFTLDIPANTVALIRYVVETTSFAPLASGSTITNTLQLTDTAKSISEEAFLTLPVANEINLEIAKCAPDTAMVNQPFSFKFIVSNYGNVPIDQDDYVVLSDFLNPALTDIEVYANGVLWTNGTEYNYSEGLFYFQTTPGAIALDAASFVQDNFGRWNTLPSSLEIIVTGNQTSNAQTQALVNILPAYADGREHQLAAMRMQNDHYVLSCTGNVPAYFMIITTPNSPLSLLQGSNKHFLLMGNLLYVDVSGITNTISALIQVEYKTGFTLRVDYTP